MAEQVTILRPSQRPLRMHASLDVHRAEDLGKVLRVLMECADLGLKDLEIDLLARPAFNVRFTYRPGQDPASILKTFGITVAESSEA